ncbi:MAG TPA: OsmC family protein [Rhodanobacteraceae bacterium]|nr:OsmC family protein [Rhodanobacteraceae bacterium]
MTMEHIAAAMQRVESVLRRRPDTGVHDDAPATARWQGSGLDVVSTHDNGTAVATNLSREIGGSGDKVSPGWLMRAGVASCAASSIILRAAVVGIELTRLEVVARSRSDTRGLLGMAGADGTAVDPAPLAIELDVRIAARDATREQLQQLVDEAHRCSPIPAAVANGVPTHVHVEIEDG